MRLDLSDKSLVRRLFDIGVNVRKFVRNDAPVDVCALCGHKYGLRGDVEHPPYSDDDYRCACCGAQLMEWYD